MHRAMHGIVIGALSLALATSSLQAHGGQYKGPADAGGPTSSGGGGNAPPTNPGGSAAPGPGAPSRPGSAVTGPTTGYGRGGNRGGSDRTKSTTGTAFESGTNFEIWEFWWENNKDRFLNLKERLIKTTNVSGGLGVLTGRGRKTDASTSRRPTTAMINSEVIPVLRKLLAGSEDRDIIDSTVLALGRVTRDDNAPAVIQDAIPLLKHKELSVQTSATLALGVLASPAAEAHLRELLADSSEGRKLVGGGEVPWLVRSFSALAIGLIGSSDSAPTLIDIIENLSDADKDIKVCAIVGLSMLQEEGVDQTVDYLSKKLSDRKMDVTIKSYIPTTLGKLGRRAALKSVLDSFADRDANNLVRQSSAIALGRLATVEDAEAVAALMDYIKEGKDVQSRHFAFISLAKIGARDADAPAHAELHEDIRSLLMGEISKPERQTNRSWAGLAAAIYGRAHPDSQPEITDRLIEAYDDEKDPSFKASFAVSLGLLNVQSVAPRIFDDFVESKDYDFKGYAAVALGFLKHVDAAEALRSRIKDKTTTPTFRLQCATGLGLMGDEQAIDVLIDTLQAAETLGVSSAVAKALGLIGDRNAIGPLNQLVQNTSKTELTRAFAAVALGIVGEKSDLPWNAVISEDNNYRARVPAIDEVLDIL